MAKQGQKLLRVGAAAHELGLHPLTVLRWIKAGRIQIVQVGREMLILLPFQTRMLITLFACFGVILTVLESGGEKTPEQALMTDLPNRGERPPHSCCEDKSRAAARRRSHFQLCSSSKE